MTLYDIISSLPLPYAEARGFALVFSQSLAARLAEVQAEHPSQHVAVPSLLTTGEYMLCGDLLSEVGPGGLYASGFGRLDHARFSEIRVVPWADALALLPPDPPSPFG